MARAGQAVGSGALGPHTRVSFRSRSATFFLLVQVVRTDLRSPCPQLPVWQPLRSAPACQY
eukprot:scaffold38552_cov30-Tisochrysis_lutea.AAC.2